MFTGWSGFGGLAADKLVVGVSPRSGYDVTSANGSGLTLSRKYPTFGGVMGWQVASLGHVWAQGAADAM